MGLVVVAAASGQNATFSVVSAASYQGVVAPNSLASIFGSGLATVTASALLDANGQLPTELGGTTVEINGEAAALIYVSPAQINFVIPADTVTGTADVFVRSGIGAGSHASVQVANTAPALFSSDATGSGQGFTQTASLALNPPATVALSNLTLSPVTVAGGSAVTATVTLTAPAPVGGTVVTLKTSAPFYTQIPLVVTVPVGATTAAFQVGTTIVPSTQSVTITATYGAVSKTATLKIQ